MLTIWYNFKVMASVIAAGANNFFFFSDMSYASAESNTHCDVQTLFELSAVCLYHQSTVHSM